MLISFKVENFRSFGKEVEFSCVATPERSHRDRVFVDPKVGLRLLTVGAIYGANGSGKSNLYRAVKVARNLVVGSLNVEAAIPIQTFRLNPALQSAPTHFEFEVMLDGETFGYRFAVTANKVVAESLREIRPASERLIYSRETSHGAEAKWDLRYFGNLGLNSEEQQFIDFVAKGTPANQLFLHEAHARNVKHFERLWRWFRYSLALIDPNSTAEALEMRREQEGINEFANRILRRADVGIERVGTRTIPLDSLDLSNEMKRMLENDCKEGPGILLHDRGSRVNIYRKDGEMKAAKLVSYHRAHEGAEPVAFDIGEESDGTQRVIDLLSTLYELTNAKREFVLFVDELDRSLHSRLTRALIEGYLRYRPENARSQFFFTTHDATLLDHELFRKDEVWLLDKNEKGESELSSLGDFKLRSDKRLMKDYLLGRFGGVPNVHRLPLQAKPAMAGTEND